MSTPGLVPFQAHNTQSTTAAKSVASSELPNGADRVGTPPDTPVADGLDTAGSFGSLEMMSDIIGDIIDIDGLEDVLEERSSEREDVEESGFSNKTSTMGGALHTGEKQGRGDERGKEKEELTLKLKAASKKSKRGRTLKTERKIMHLAVQQFLPAFLKAAGHSSYSNADQFNTLRALAKQHTRLHAQDEIALKEGETDELEDTHVDGDDIEESVMSDFGASGMQVGEDELGDPEVNMKRTDNYNEHDVLNMSLLKSTEFMNSLGDISAKTADLIRNVISQSVLAAIKELPKDAPSDISPEEDQLKYQELLDDLHKHEPERMEEFVEALLSPEVLSELTQIITKGFGAQIVAPEQSKL